ncbi:MAG: hypothetical protein HYV63_07945 [Candidatus Schekmanbacteria bacterium]|nr:hypothetical protein [Candidatus Schekmanbacteria bacterium]
MTERLNKCGYGGLLVDATLPVPADPEEYFAEGSPATGCNRLRCHSCGTSVRQGAGFYPRQDAANHLSDLVASPHWRSLPYLEYSAGSEFRLYVCRCELWVTRKAWYRLEDRDPDPITDPKLPWRCEGHPPSQLPLTLNGVTVRSQEDLLGVIRRRLLAGPTLGPEASANGAGVWLASLYARLAGGPAEGDVSRAVAACLSDPEPRVRAWAVSFFRSFPRAEGGERIQDLLKGDRSLFRGVADPTTLNSTLEASLLFALAKRLGTRDAQGRPRALELARREALVGSGVGDKPLFYPLALHDTEWLAANAAQIIEVRPQSAEELLFKFAVALGDIEARRVARANELFVDLAIRLARERRITVEDLHRSLGQCMVDLRSKVLEALDESWRTRPRKPRR